MLDQASRIEASEGQKGRWVQKPKYALMGTVTGAAIPNRQSDSLIWFTDSGASDHFSPHRNLFETFHKLEEPVSIATAEGTATGIDTGTITITVLSKDDMETELQPQRHLCTHNELKSILAQCSV